MSAQTITKGNHMKTRLQVLCEIHNQQGGTIHQFNQKYKFDLLSFSNFQFKTWILYKFGYETYVKYREDFVTDDISQWLNK